MEAPPTRSETVPQGAANLLPRASLMPGRPPISAMPTARAWAAVAPNGATALRIVIRSALVRTGRGKATTPPGPTGSGGVAPPGQEIRTRTALRTGSSGASRRSVWTRTGTRARH